MSEVEGDIGEESWKCKACIEIIINCGAWKLKGKKLFVLCISAIFTHRCLNHFASLTCTSNSLLLRLKSGSCLSLLSLLCLRAFFFFFLSLQFLCFEPQEKGWKIEGKSCLHQANAERWTWWNCWFSNWSFQNFIFYFCF